MLEEVAAVQRRPLCWFSKTAVTEHHDLLGLKQRKCILPQLWRSEGSIRQSDPPGGACRGHLLAVSSSVWRLPALPRLWRHHSDLCPHLHVTNVSFAICVLRVPLIRALVIGFGVHAAHLR